MSATGRKDSAIAAAATLAAAILVLLLLLFTRLPDARRVLADASIPEPEGEELYIAPELIALGEADAVTADEAAPSLQGEPEQAETEQTQTIIPGEAETPAPPRPATPVQQQESPVSHREPKKTEHAPAKATRAMAGQFSTGGDRSGKPDAVSGTGGSGAGVTGQARGRSFLGCDKPDVQLRQKTVVTVQVTVDADGRVTSATASGGASAAIRRECERAARTARWSAKRGATATPGTLTFTLVPR